MTEKNFEDYCFNNQQAKAQVFADLRKNAGYTNGKLFAKEKLLMAPNQYMRYETGANMKDISRGKILWCHHLTELEFALLVHEKLKSNNN